MARPPHAPPALRPACSPTGGNRSTLPHRVGWGLLGATLIGCASGLIVLPGTSHVVAGELLAEPDEPAKGDKPDSESASVSPNSAAESSPSGTTAAARGDLSWEAAAEDALPRAGDNRQELERALRLVPTEQRTGMAFLIANMPEQDLRTLSADHLLENVSLAYQARAAVPWGQAIPEDIFLNDVLPYANVNEPRDPWRKEFFERFLPLVRDLETPSQAAQKLNQTVFQQLGVRYSTGRKRADQSPRESMEQGLASCTGLSIILSDACRAVCVPARLAGTPLWANERGNHTWVEVWDKQWHFTGAAEPSNQGLNHGWFQHDASQAIKDSRLKAIYASSFRRTETSFPLVWAPRVDWVYAVNVTDRYTGAEQPMAANQLRLLVRVWDAEGKTRLERPVEVTCLTCQGKPQQGTSRGEAADTNDILAFEVPRGQKVQVQVGRGPTAKKVVVATLDQDEQLVEVRHQ